MQITSVAIIVIELLLFCSFVTAMVIFKNPCWLGWGWLGHRHVLRS